MIKLGIWSRFKRYLFPELMPLKKSQVLMEEKLQTLQNKINQQNTGIIQNSNISDKCRLYPKYNIIDCEIGDYTYIAQNSNISKTSIGKFCSIGPNFISGWGIHPLDGISTSPMFYSTKNQNGKSFSKTDKIVEREKIEIGNDVFIGMNVIILDGVKIGDGAVIGAGAVVSKDVPPYAVAVGCPINILKYRFDESFIKKLLEIKWWNFNEENLQDVERYFFEVDKFIDKYINA